MDDEQNTLIQDKSASPGHQFDFLIGRALSHVTSIPAICVVVERPLEWSPRHLCGRGTRSTAIISSDRGKQPQLISAASHVLPRPSRLNCPQMAGGAPGHRD